MVADAPLATAGLLAIVLLRVLLEKLTSCNRVMTLLISAHCMLDVLVCEEIHSVCRTYMHHISPQSQQTIPEQTSSNDDARDTLPQPAPAFNCPNLGERVPKTCV